MTLNSAVVLSCLDPQVDPLVISNTVSKPAQDHINTTSGESSYNSILATDSQWTDYKFSHQLGRRFHQFGTDTYWLPNDGQEINRLDLQHLIWRLTLGGQLHLPPLDSNIRHVLDIGTGTGSWAIDFAKEHPDCQVIGTDLSPIQPRSQVPDNCTFVISNAEEPWDDALGGNREFDLVHNRHLLFGMHDWKKYLDRVWERLKSGGWIQMIEPVFPFRSISGLEEDKKGTLIEYSRLCHEALLKVGIDTQKPLSFGDMMRDKGWKNVETRLVKWPLGSWPLDETEKELGKMNVKNILGFLDGSAKMLWTKNLGWTEEQVDEFLVDVKRDIDDDANTYYFPIVIAWAQKV